VLILEMPHFQCGTLCKALTKKFITIGYHGKKEKGDKVFEKVKCPLESFKAS
jgi:hypothetical protein